MERNFDVEETYQRQFQGNVVNLTMRTDGLTDDQKDDYVTYHNYHRRNVEPLAAYMKKMVIYLFLLYY